MKKLLAILLLLPTIAFAQDTSWFARAKTTAGGDIVLTTVRGPCTGNQLSMYLAARGGNVRWGCYFVTDLHTNANVDVSERVPVRLPEQVSALGIQSVAVQVGIKPIIGIQTVTRRPVIQGLGPGLAYSLTLGLVDVFPVRTRAETQFA